MHYFPSKSEKEIIWHTSWTNLNMYLATIPSYESDESEDKSASKGKPVDKATKELKDFFAGTKPKF